MTPVATLTAAGLVFDAASHVTSTPEGVVVPNTTRILSDVGLSSNFEDLAQLSTRIAENIAHRCALGSTVHADCWAHDDDDLDWSTVHPESSPFIEAWATCRRNLHLVPLTRERRVFHPLYFYTGILDGIFLCETTGRRILGDLKIGDPEDAACQFQTASYAEAYLAEHPDETIDERWAIKLCPDLQIPYRIVNYTAPNRPEAWQDFQKFQAALCVWNEQPSRRKAIR